MKKIGANLSCMSLDFVASLALVRAASVPAGNMSMEAKRMFDGRKHHELFVVSNGAKKRIVKEMPLDILKKIKMRSLQFNLELQRYRCVL